MKTIIQTLSTPLAIWAASFFHAAAEDLDLGDVDKEFYLLGMADMPRIESDGDETAKNIFSYFVFNNRATAEAFVGIAESIGVDDLEIVGWDELLKGTEAEGQADYPAYLVKSAQLEDRFAPLVAYTEFVPPEDDFDMNKALSFGYRFGYQTYAEIAKNGFDASGLPSTIRRIGYPNLAKMDKEQARSFVLGIVASRAAFYNPENPDMASTGAGPAEYHLGFLRIQSLYADMLDSFIEWSDVEVVNSRTSSIGYGSIRMAAYGWNLDIPEAYESAVRPLVAAREARAKEATSALKDPYLIRTYNLFTY